MLLIGGYSLMACWGGVFTVALCLQVGGWDKGKAPQEGALYPSPALFLSQSVAPGMSYLAMCCIFAFILSFGIGPGE